MQCLQLSEKPAALLRPEPIRWNSWSSESQEISRAKRPTCWVRKTGHAPASGNLSCDEAKIDCSLRMTGCGTDVTLPLRPAPRSATRLHRRWAWVDHRPQGVGGGETPNEFSLSARI